MVERASALLEQRDTGRHGPTLLFAVASGPYRQVIRPAELEDPQLARDLQREGMFGDHSVLGAGESTSIEIRRDTLYVTQSDSSLAVDQSGAIRIAQPPGQDHRQRVGQLPSIVEEDLLGALARATMFAGWILDRIDPLRRLTDVVPAAQLVGADYLPWRTRAEQQANPNVAGIGIQDSGGPVFLTPPRRPRPALIHDAEALVADLMTLLRRGHRS